MHTISLDIIPLCSQLKEAFNLLARSALAVITRNKGKQVFIFLSWSYRSVHSRHCTSWGLTTSPPWHIQQFTEAVMLVTQQLPPTRCSGDSNSIHQIGKMFLRDNIRHCLLCHRALVTIVSGTSLLHAARKVPLAHNWQQLSGKLTAAAATASWQSLVISTFQLDIQGLEFRSSVLTTKYSSIRERV